MHGKLFRKRTEARMRDCVVFSQLKKEEFTDETARNERYDTLKRLDARFLLRYYDVKKEGVDKWVTYYYVAYDRTSVLPLIEVEGTRDASEVATVSENL